jgi:hypothetical protein
VTIGSSRVVRPDSEDTETIRRAVWVWLSLFAVAPVFRCSALRSSESTREQTLRRSPAHAFPVLRRHCRVSPQPPVSRLQRPFPVAADPFGSAPASGFGPLSAPGSSHPLEEGDVRPQGSERRSGAVGAHGDDLRGGRDTLDRQRRFASNPKIRGEPPERAVRPKPTHSLPSPLPAGDGKPSSTLKGARGGELVVSYTQARRVSSESTAASLRPDSPKKASRRITRPRRI